MAPPAAVGSVGLIAIGRHRERGRELARVSPLPQLQVDDDTRAVGKVAYQGARNHDSSGGFELVGSVGPCPTDCSPLQVVEEPSSKFTSNCRTPPQAGGPNLLYGGGATCYPPLAPTRRARPKALLQCSP